MLEAGRVAEVWARARPKGMFGSGYFIDGELVLTAGHVVDRGACQVRELGAAAWSEAEVVWRGGDFDAALLKVSGRAGFDRVDFGRLATNEPTECRAVGFPSAQKKIRHQRTVRDTEDLFGEIRPLAGAKEDLLTVDIASSVPVADPDSKHSPWSGMSGAALFAGGLLIGVILIHPENYGTSRLEAVPIPLLADDREFGQALGQTKLTIPAVEDVDITRGVLRAPYRPLPKEATPEALRNGATAFLMESVYGVVPFHGREGGLRRLEDWCTGDRDIAIGLLTGAGGTGKTRLAAELCRRQQSAGVVAGFLDPESGERATQLAEVHAPLLVVVDEAHARTSEAGQLLAALARKKHPEPARVLLVARQQGEWWPQALGEDLPDDPDARFLLATGASDFGELASLEETPEQRHVAFATATEAFSAVLNVQEPEQLPQLIAPVFESIFFIHLAALTVLEGKAALLTAGVVAEDLLGWALDREARYWSATAKHRKLALSASTLQQAVAVATLTSATTADEATTALRAVPDLSDEKRRVLRATASWLRSLYPVPDAAPSSEASTDEEPETWFRPLTPDLLGEALVAKVLSVEATPELASELIACAPAPVQVRRSLTVLTQAARKHPAARAGLEAALEQHFESVWRAGIEVAQQAGDPIGTLMAAVLEQVPKPGLAAAIHESLPHDSVALRELAAVATGQALAAISGPSVPDDAAEAQAGLSNDLSIRLSELGRREDALTAVEEAVTIYRQLPDASHLPNLAAALNSQSNRLSELGRFEDALTAIEEAVAIYRQLADARPGAFLATLATALNNQSNRLSELGRREDALTAIEEAVTIYRQLADARSGAYRPGLAMALTNQSSCLSELGRREDALTAIEEAGTIYRQLADARPDAYRPNLATALNNQSNRLSELGRREDALTAIEEAVTIRRQLADVRPDAFLPDLAAAVNNQSIRLSELGRREDALTAIEEAVTIRRQLADARPDAFLPNLASALSNQSSCLSELGRREDALTAVEEAVTIDRQLADTRPDAFLPDLAMALNNQSMRLSELGRLKEALTAVETAIRDILPMLERGHYFLPDAGVRLVQNYVRLSKEADIECNPSLLKRMQAVFVKAGLVPADE